MTYGNDPTPGPTRSGGPPRSIQATVITDAEPSYDEQLRSRRKRYSIMMGMRVPCLILAMLLYQTPWLAILVIAISIPLPWMAVLIANDRPARKRRGWSRARQLRARAAAGQPRDRRRRRPTAEPAADRCRRRQGGVSRAIGRRAGRRSRAAATPAPCSAVPGPAPPSQAASSPALKASPAPVESASAPSVAPPAVPSAARRPHRRLRPLFDRPGRDIDRTSVAEYQNAPCRSVGDGHRASDASTAPARPARPVRRRWAAAGRRPSPRPGSAPRRRRDVHGGLRVDRCASSPAARAAVSAASPAGREPSSSST